MHTYAVCHNRASKRKIRHTAGTHAKKATHSAVGAIHLVTSQPYPLHTMNAAVRNHATYHNSQQLSKLRSPSTAHFALILRLPYRPENRSSWLSNSPPSLRYECRGRTGILAACHPLCVALPSSNATTNYQYTSTSTSTLSACSAALQLSEKKTYFSGSSKNGFALHLYSNLKLKPPLLLDPSTPKWLVHNITKNF